MYKAENMSSPEAESSGQNLVAVGIDVGSFNSRMSTYDERLEHPTIVNNPNGNRFTRSLVEDQCIFTNPDLQKEFLSNQVLPHICDASHQPLSQLRVVLAVPTASASAADESSENHVLSSIPESNRIGLISEASAICLAYHDEDNWNTSNETVLVVDGGASGVKLSLLKQSQSTDSSPLWTILKQDINTAVSGQALTEMLGQFVAQQFEQKCRFPKGEAWSSKKVRKKLQSHSEVALNSFSKGANNATIHVDGLYEGMDCQVLLSKPRWDMLSGSLKNSIKASLKAIIGQDDARHSVDSVLLAGNLHAWLKPICEEIFGPGLLETPNGFDPAEAICFGCAKQAYYNLSNEVSTLQPTTKVSVSPVSIAIEENEGESRATSGNPTILIPKGSPLPAFARYKSATNGSPDEEETKSESATILSILQLEPARKELASLENAQGQAVRIQLSEDGKLSIAVGNELVTIG